MGWYVTLISLYIWWKSIRTYKIIWIKFGNLENIDMYALPVYDDRYIKTKIITHGDKVYTNLCGLNVPENDVEYESFTLGGGGGMGLNFQILFVMVVVIWQFCVQVLEILLLSLFKVLLMVVLFMSLSNLLHIYKMFIN